MGEVKKVRFKADDDDYLWTVVCEDYGITDGGDLDYCIRTASDAIGNEIESQYDEVYLEMNSNAIDSLYKSKITEIRSKCLQDGSASGNSWSIFHDSLGEEE